MTQYIIVKDLGFMATTGKLFKRSESEYAVEGAPEYVAIATGHVAELRRLCADLNGASRSVGVEA